MRIVLLALALGSLACSAATGPNADPDGDGIPSHADRCPLEPEDIDGWQDDDGCPDLDNDEDGVPDVSDACPLQPMIICPGADPRDGRGCPDDLCRKGRLLPP